MTHTQIKNLAKNGWIKITTDANRKYESLYFNGFYFNPVADLKLQDLDGTKVYGPCQISEAGMKSIFE
jgi:hypothetical protein